MEPERVLVKLQFGKPSPIILSRQVGSGILLLKPVESVIIPIMWPLEAVPDMESFDSGNAAVIADIASSSKPTNEYFSIFLSFNPGYTASAFGSEQDDLI